jgi:hypothetical protein
MGLKKFIFLWLCFVNFQSFSFNMNGSSAADSTLKFKKVEKLVHKIQIILDRTDRQELKITRKVYNPHLGEPYYHKTAVDIYKLSQKLTIASKSVPDSLPLRQHLDGFTAKWNSTDAIFRDLNTKKRDLHASLFGLTLQIPNRSLHYSRWETETTGEKIALILFLALVILIPVGLLYWAIAGKVILPIILLILYLAFVGLAAAFLKGLRNAFRR